jgi:hypothetical protein
MSPLWRSPSFCTRREIRIDLPSGFAMLKRRGAPGKDGNRRGGSRRYGPPPTESRRRLPSSTPSCRASPAIPSRVAPIKSRKTLKSVYAGFL